jgi:hypothetical protein
MPQRRTTGLLYLVLLFLTAFVVPQTARAGFTIGTDASNFALLFEGAGANTLQVTNVTVNGNVGVGLTGQATDSGPSTINGGLDFSAANTSQFSNNNAADIIAGGVHYSVAAVASALSTVNSLNTTLGAESGTNIAIGTGGGQTLSINAAVLTINGDAAGDSVVLNFTGSVNFNNQVRLNGLSSDQVLYNFVGGSNLTGGPTLQINDNLSNNAPNCSLGQFCVQGVFLDPNGAISVTNANVAGRVFGGDTHDFQYVSGSTITASMTTVPEPSNLLELIGFSAVILLAAARRKKSIRS